MGDKKIQFQKTIRKIAAEVRINSETLKTTVLQKKNDIILYGRSKDFSENYHHFYSGGWG